VKACEATHKGLGPRQTRERVTVRLPCNLVDQILEGVVVVRRKEKSNPIVRGNSSRTKEQGHKGFGRAWQIQRRARDGSYILWYDSAPGLGAI
jgi:hypothetical protein